MKINICKHAIDASVLQDKFDISLKAKAGRLGFRKGSGPIQFSKALTTD